MTIVSDPVWHIAAGVERAECVLIANLMWDDRRQGTVSSFHQNESILALLSIFWPFHQIEHNHLLRCSNSNKFNSEFLQPWSCVLNFNSFFDVFQIKASWQRPTNSRMHRLPKRFSARLLVMGRVLGVFILSSLEFSGWRTWGLGVPFRGGDYDHGKLVYGESCFGTLLGWDVLEV